MFTFAIKPMFIPNPKISESVFLSTKLARSDLDHCGTFAGRDSPCEKLVLFLLCYFLQCLPPLLLFYK